VYRSAQRSAQRRSGVQECTEKEWCTGVYKRSAVPESTVKRSCGHESKEKEWHT
jgi:hypothetical protein